MTGWQRVKQVVNLLNLTTLAGFLVAGIGRAKVSRGPRGLFFATEYRIKFPDAGAFTIGNVVLTKHDRAWLDARENLVRHEERHSWQYLCLVGVPFWLFYLLAAGWSRLRTVDFYSRNLFERLAGLEDGGYVEHQPRPLLGAIRTAIRTGLRSRPPAQ